MEAGALAGGVHGARVAGVTLAERPVRVAFAPLPPTLPDLQLRVTRNFSLYLALRYLRPKRTFVSVITVISVLGVSLGVAVLIVVIAVMAGFHDQMRELALGYETHIEVRDSYGTSMMDDKKRPEGMKDKPWREVLEAIKKTEGVISATPMVRGLLLVETEVGMSVAGMWGVKDEDGNRLASKHEKFLVAGSLDLKGDNIVLDEALAGAWGLKLGDTVTVYAPSNLKSIVQNVRQIDELPEAEKKAAYEKLKELVLPLDLTLVGVISPPQFQDSDKIPLAVVPLNVAQELRELDDGITSIGVEVSEPYQAPTIRKRMVEAGVLSEGWETRTWLEAHQRLFAAVQNEMMMMYVILFIIILVAAFCVMNTMITVTVQKRREIGIVAALGSRMGQTMWVFMIQGMIVGAAGSLVGLGLGLLIAKNINLIRDWLGDKLGVEMFDEQIYGLAELPAKVLPMDVTIICSGAFILCSLAAIVPAWLAARVEPAQALRD